MIVEITGLPGNGKTLYAIKYVKDWAERENRPVFYSGIKGLKLPWTEIDAEKWYDCPTGAIILIDECQRVFRPRSMGKEVPLHVSQLETHRHKGVDLVLITQHPLLTDTAVRRLVGLHFHVVRKWGTQNATIHEFPSVRENCDKEAGRKDSIRHHWKFDKSIYDLYESAELHTHKRRIPMRVIIFCLLPFLLGACIWYMVAWNKKKIEGNSSASQLPPGTKPVKMSGSSGGGDAKKASYKDAMDDAKQFMFDRTPRVAGLVHTAPRYDEVTKPTRAPLPVACVSSGDRCTCYSQQATRLDVDKKTCLQIVANGFFIDHDQEKGQGHGGGVVAQTSPGAIRPETVPVADSAPVQPVQFREMEESPNSPQNRPRPHLAQNTAVKQNTTPMPK